MAGESSRGQISIERIFIKRLQYVAPDDLHEVFALRWQPKMSLDINARHRELEDDRYEVALRVVVVAEIGKKRAFRLQFDQAGHFQVRGLDGDALLHVMSVICPDILFPYAREAADSMLVKAGFPPVRLAPVSFEAVFQQAMGQQARAELRKDAEVVN